MDMNVSFPTDEQFQEQLIAAIAKQVAERIPTPDVPEPLLTRAKLAKAFEVGGGTIDQWRMLPGFPYHLKGEKSEAYLYSEVYDWLKNNTRHA